MKQLLDAVWTLLLALSVSAAQIKVKGNETEAVMITCSHSWATGNRKYFCRFPCASERDVVVDSVRRSQGRYQLQDNGNVFTVTINHLQKGDSGTYWCAVDRAMGDTYTEIILTVLEAPQTTPSPRSSSRSPSPALISSMGATSSYSSTQAPVSPSANLLNENHKAEWLLYLFVSLGVLMVTSLVTSLLVLALNHKRIFNQFRCCSGERQVKVSDYDEGPDGNRSSSSSDPPPPDTESLPDYENILFNGVTHPL